MMPQLNPWEEHLANLQQQNAPEEDQGLFFAEQQLPPLELPEETARKKYEARLEQMYGIKPGKKPGFLRNLLAALGEGVSAVGQTRGGKDPYVPPYDKYLKDALDQYRVAAPVRQREGAVEAANWRAQEALNQKNKALEVTAQRDKAMAEYRKTLTDIQRDLTAGRINLMEAQGKSQEAAAKLSGVRSDFVQQQTQDLQSRGGLTGDAANAAIVSKAPDAFKNPFLDTLTKMSKAKAQARPPSALSSSISQLLRNPDGSLTGRAVTRQGGVMTIPGLAGERTTALSAADRKEAGDIERLYSEAQLVEDLYKKWEPKGYTGPVAGVGINLTKNFLPHPKEVQDMYNTAQKFKATVLYLFSGKQINEQEYKRLSRFLPDPARPDTAFYAQMDMFKRELRAVLDRKAKEAGKALGQGASGTGSTVERLRRLSEGR